MDGFIIRSGQRGDLDAINDIYNEAILTSTATWDEEPWSGEQRREWFEERTEAAPLLVADLGGRCVGFAYLSYYRPKSGYRFTRESTIYLHGSVRGQGLGATLLVALVEEARRIGVHCLVAVIAGDNAASIALHAKVGFDVVGTKRECGFKFGAWQDLTEMAKVI